LPFHQALVVIVFNLVIKQVKLRLTITSRRKKELVLKLVMETGYGNWF